MLSKEIIRTLEKLPFFDITIAKNLIPHDSYLRMIVSRYSKLGKIVRLMKGFYTSKSYIDMIQKQGRYSSFVEFIANVLYPASYISGEYVLHKHNILTESVVTITNMSLCKTAHFSNSLGNFIYHTIKKDLFTGYTMHNREDFTIFEATKAKALFDYLYLRKKYLTHKSSIRELRLNIDSLTTKDMNELKKYVRLENSKRLKMIYSMLFREDT